MWQHLLQTVSDIERISDYCENISEFAENLYQKKLRFSKVGQSSSKKCWMCVQIVISML